MFYNILRAVNLDWKKAREIFYNLTETQIVWLDEMFKREKKTAEYTQESKIRRVRKYV